MRYNLVVFAFVLFFNWSNGQSISYSGVSGYFNTPSSAVLSDGNFVIGASLIPKTYHNLYNSGSSFSALPTYINLGLFNRIEFVFRYTHLLGQIVSPETRYFPDRMIAVKGVLYKGTETLPSVSIGLHDFTDAIGGSSASPWFLSTYLVISKAFDFGGFVLNSSLGYGFDILDSERDPILNGVFSAFSISSRLLKGLHLAFEYDTSHFNGGLFITPIKNISFGVSLLNMQAFSGNFYFKVNLLK